MKKISGSRDLAINGAEPAFSEPLHVGRPNIGDQARFLELTQGILDSGWLTNNGPLVQELEGRIAERLGVRNCVAMSNGTVALEIAIRALDLRNEVIVPSWTFIATAHALHWQEITPVFADVSRDTHNLDPESVIRMITPRTTGIIGVHLWGRAAPVKELTSIADKYGLKLLFDSAHAFGCSYGQELIGKFGSCEVLSFHGTKCLNSMEGGAVVTNDDVLAEKLRLMRNFGFSGYDNVIYPGTNGKLTESCAAMGLVNLKAFDKFVAINERNYRSYQSAFANVPNVELIEYPAKVENNFHYIVLELQDKYSTSRDRLVEILHAEKILARKYFWPGCHRMLPYRDLFPHSGLLLPNTEEISEKVVVLPTGPAIGSDEIETVVAVVRICAEENQTDDRARQ